MMQTCSTILLYEKCHAFVRINVIGSGSIPSARALLGWSGSLFAVGHVVSYLRYAGLDDLEQVAVLDLSTRKRTYPARLLQHLLRHTINSCSSAVNGSTSTAWHFAKILYHCKRAKKCE